MFHQQLVLALGQSADSAILLKFEGTTNEDAARTGNVMSRRRAGEVLLETWRMGLRLLLPSSA